MKKSIFLLGAVILLAQLHLSAQDESPISTDRPNTTDATGLLLPGTLQFEFGYFHQSDKQGGATIKDITQPNVGIKYGITDWVEIRLLGNYLSHKEKSSTQDDKLSGMTALILSPKFRVLEQEGWLSKISLTTSFTFPDIGKTEFQNKEINLGYRVLVENSLGGKFSLAHAIGADWDDNSKAVWALSSVLGISHTDKIGTFWEVYGTLASEFSDTILINGGMTYFLNNNLQADAMIGIGLNDAAADYYISFGIAWRTSL